MPISFCIWAAENNSKNQLRLFLWLKFLYPEGKFKYNKEAIKLLSKSINYKSDKSTVSNIDALLNLRWLIENKKTELIIIKSFERIRKQNDWNRRIAVITYQGFLENIQGLIGAAIFTGLYEDIKKKEKEGSFVLSKGGTYTNFPTSSKHSKYKPIALTGFAKMFKNFNLAKASRLKKEAMRAGHILVKKNYTDLKFGISNHRSISNHFNNVVSKNDKLYLQLIDTIYPLITTRRRKKL